jgi:hypothetical protein
MVWFGELGYRTGGRLGMGPECGYEREYLRSYVRQLRLKIEDNPADPKYLLTEPNIGYRFAESLEEDSAISSSNPVVAEA